MRPVKASPRSEDSPVPKIRQRETGCHLVGIELQHQHTEQQGRDRPADGGTDDADPGIAGDDRDGETADRPDQHHALDAEIEHAGLFDHQLAKPRKQDRRGQPDNGDDGRDEEIDAHDWLPAAGMTPRG